MTVKQIFLIDALGAAVSVILVVLILPAFQLWHGMPMDALLVCGVWSTVSLVYSASCFGLADLLQSKWLQGIIWMNTAYCGFTVLLIGSHFHALTPLGVVYFLTEISVILGLVLWERRVYRTIYCSSS
jgi:hypothetical protein